MTYAADPASYAAGTAALFEMLRDGWRAVIGTVRSL